MIDVRQARALSNQHGFEQKVEKRIVEIERRIMSACEQGRTSTCAFAFYSDSDKSDVDREAKKHFKKKGFRFKRTGMNGGVIQDTEDICW